jgi:hypothetical protein
MHLVAFCKDDILPFLVWLGMPVVGRVQQVMRLGPLQLYNQLQETGKIYFSHKQNYLHTVYKIRCRDYLNIYTVYITNTWI